MTRPDVYHLSPINGTAAAVTSQSGVTTELTHEHRLENLKSAAAQLNHWFANNKHLKGRPEHTERGQRALEINTEISKLRKVPRKQPRDLQSFIVDVCKDRMTQHEWHAVVEEAKRRYRVTLP